MRTLFILTLTASVIGAAWQRRAVADEEFSLVIDPFTGATSLRNDATSAADVDGYFVTSGGAPVLDTVGWNSLNDSGFIGWTETSSPVGDRLGEVNLFGSLTFSAGESIGIGNAYTPFAPSEVGEVEPGFSNLDFSYTLAGESSARIGDVEFSARNTVVLVVDPTSGAATLQNQSAFNINLDGYLLTSSQDVLDNTSWTPLADGDAAWTAATGAANRLAEGNLFGSTLLAANGGSLSIGNAINPAMLNDEADLELDFSVEGIGTIAGGVLFAPSAPSADFDDDGDVDGNDLTDPVDGFLARYGNDLSGSDFLNWQRQFGGPAPLAGSLAAVPEPTSVTLIVSMAVAFATSCRTRRTA